MTLQPVRLDDLNWRAMVEAIRGRIAAVSGEEWTLHAPVDPGVTLMELFAHLLEQRLYWMDQVPDTLIRGLMALLAAEQRPAISARTLIEIIPGGVATVDAGAVFSLRNGDALIRLTGEDEVAVLPVDRIDVSSPFGAEPSRAEPAPRWVMQPLTLLPAGGAPGEFQITLWLKAAPTAEQTGKPLTLLLELEEPAKVAAGWTTEAVEDVPPPASLAWAYGRSGPPARGAFAPQDVKDGTQGLRRSGVVAFAIPADWASVQASQNGLFPFSLWVGCNDTTFSAPPLLLRIVPNVTAAAHMFNVPVDNDAMSAQLDQWLPLPGMVVSLPDRAPPIEPTVALRLLGRDGVWRDWKPAWDFSWHGPADPVIQVDRTFNCLRFGDGLTGRLPVPANQPDRIELRYMVGGGEPGNLGSSLDWVSTAGIAAINPVPVRGGRESETPAEARERVAALLLEIERAVTLADHEWLAISTPGVAVRRAKAIAGFHPGFPCVNVPGAISVFIVPDVPRGDDWLASDRAVKAPQPDPGMLSQVRGRLDERRLLTSELFVLGPRYRAVEVIATIGVGALDRGAMAERLRVGLTDYLDALIGGEEGNGWPFGQPIRPSELAHQLQRLAGRDADIERVAARLAGGTPANAFEDCVDITIAAHELVVLGALKIVWRPRAGQTGGLQ